MLSLNVSDPDGDILNVSFYNGLDNNLIGTDTEIISGGTASTFWLNLSEGITCSWYVVISDNLTSITSSTWTFITFLDIPQWIQAPSDQNIEFGDFLYYNINASDFSGIDKYWINNLRTFNINDNGIITSKEALSVRGYFLEVKAYDPFSNNCTALIMIYVKDTTNPTWDSPLIDQTLESGDDLLSFVNASDLSGIIRYQINHSSCFAIDNEGILTNGTRLIPGSYWLEVKAYDPYSNYCTGFIKITVNFPKKAVNFILPEIPPPITLFLIGTISTLAFFLVKNKIRKDH